MMSQAGGAETSRHLIKHIHESVLVVNKKLFQLKRIIHLFISTLKPFVSVTQHISIWYSLITR